MAVLRPIVSKIRTIIGERLPFNEVTRVSRHIALFESIGGFAVPQPGGQSDLHLRAFDAPGLVAQSLPVIFFRTMPSGTSTFQVRLNSTILMRRTLTGGNEQSWHEIIPSGALKAESNELVFSVSGGGSVQFSDVVVLYTSNKLTVEEPPVLDPG
jgi:hypothetical protein